MCEDPWVNALFWAMVVFVALTPLTLVTLVTLVTRRVSCPQ